MKRDNLTNALASAVADARERLLQGWFGRGFERPERGASTGDWDAVLEAKAFPDQIGDKSPLQTLKSDHAREQGHPSLSIASGWDFAKEPSLDRDTPGIER